MAPLVVALAAASLLIGGADAKGALVSPEPRDDMDEGYAFPLSANRARFETRFTEKCPVDEEEESEPGDIVAVVKPGMRFYVKYDVDEQRVADVSTLYLSLLVIPGL